MDYFGPKEERSFDYKLKIIDILRQSSSGELSGMEALFRLRKDNVPHAERDKIVVSITVTLTSTKSKMKVVGGKVFEYNKVGKRVLFIFELLHESISTEDGTVKIALFYEGDKAVKKYVKCQRIGKIVEHEYETSKAYLRQV